MSDVAEIEEEWIIGAKAFTRRTGLTYRQMDHWVRRGVLVPLTGARGSGSRREFDELEIEVATTLRSLVKFGQQQQGASMNGISTDFLRAVAALLRDDTTVRWVRLNPLAVVPEPTCDGAVYLSVVAE